VADLERVGAIPARGSRLAACEECGREITETCYEVPDNGLPFGGQSVWVAEECECAEVDELAGWREERGKARLEKLVGLSELPSRFARFTFATFDASHSPDAAGALDAAREYDFVDGICFVGSTGTGKTHLACAVLAKAIDRSIPSLFVTVPSLLERIRQAYRDDVDSDLLPRAQNAAFLVLDDLGAEKPTGWVQEKLFALVNHRYSMELPTVVTTNLMPDELSERIGQRTVSRLAESCRWVRLNGEDHRMRGLT
jgi:DNA replication protein DnaC